MILFVSSATKSSPKGFARPLASALMRPNRSPPGVPSTSSAYPAVLAPSCPFGLQATVDPLTVPCGHCHALMIGEPRYATATRYWASVEFHVAATLRRGIGRALSSTLRQPQ